METWFELRPVERERFRDAFGQLYWAIQVAGSIGENFVEPMPAWAHLALSWYRGRFRTQEASEDGFFVSLDPVTLRLSLHGRFGAIASDFDLHGETPDAAYVWLADAISELTGRTSPEIRHPANHELPQFGRARTEAFNATATSDFAMITRWYANAALVLESVSSNCEGASPVRCWPHHFDMATLITLDQELPSEEARRIGVGLAPGDQWYDEPYWYVSPWPYPEESDLPRLAGGGRWHREEWTGAVFTAARTLAAISQESAVRGFLDSAIDACYQVLDPGRSK